MLFIAVIWNWLNGWLMKKIWTEWKEAGVDTIQKAEEYERIRSEKKRSKNPGAGSSRPVGYEQHHVSDDELNHLLINVDEE